MNKIYKVLELYSRAGLVHNSHSVLFKRLKEYEKKYPFSKEQTKQLLYSIQYPLMNGIFVVMLDCCKRDEFRKYMTHSIIPQSVQSKVNHFYNKVKSKSKLQNANIDINTFRFKSFQNKKIQPSLNTRPRLTSSLYKK